MKDSILIVNRGNCSNLGDQAINDAMSKFIMSRYDYDIHFSDLTAQHNSPLEISKKNNKSIIAINFRQKLKKILPLKLIWLLRNFNRVKAAIKSGSGPVVIGGGQLILSNSTFGIACALWVFLSKYYSRKVIFCSVGAGSTFSKIDLILYKYALQRCDGVCVRDNESKILLKSYFDINSYCSGDIVFTEMSLDKCIDKNKKVLLGIPDVSVYNTYNKPVGREGYYKIWCCFLRDRGIELPSIDLFFTTQEDYYESLFFRDYVEREYGVKLPIVEASNLSSLKLLMCQYTQTVSGRMHGLILALNSGCSVHTFPISKKLSVFNSIISSDDFNLVNYKDNVVRKTEEFFSPYLRERSAS
ncbi:polysaccharide pyruvyl transferase family protein [Aeromonas caviae]|uniref:polysaccharide pyruvyl transferase family protein n=1 Tax=Aeromonas caviae TaxID=648 RepID=UPI0038CFDCCE